MDEKSRKKMLFATRRGSFLVCADRVWDGVRRSSPGSRNHDVGVGFPCGGVFTLASQAHGDAGGEGVCGVVGEPDCVQDLCSTPCGSLFHLCLAGESTENITLQLIKLEIKLSALNHRKFIALRLI